MKPYSPVINGMEMMETVYAKDQPQYTPLPTLKNSQHHVLSRFKLTDAERTAIFEGADIYVCVLTFGQPLQPFMISVEHPDDTLTDKNIAIASKFGLEVKI